MNYSAKVDANQKEITKAFRDLGVYVLLVHRLKNCCDLIVVYKSSTVAVEIKDGTKVPSRRQLTEGEEKFRDNWTANGGHWQLVESVDDAIKLFKWMKDRG